MAKKVCLDAGWGGSQVGSTGNGLKCKDINLTVTLKTGDILKKRGVEVVYTRTTDVNVSLSNRVKLANNSNVELYVVVHSNAYRKSSAKGYETFYYKSLDKTFASRMHSSILSDTSLYQVNRGLKKGNYYVLKNTKMPACMPVLGFITNTGDANIIKAKMDAFAQKIADAICGELGVPITPVPPPEPPLPPTPPPKLGAVTVSSATTAGGYKLTYTATAGSGTLTHWLRVNNAEWVKITPTLTSGSYVYNGSGLSEGANSGQIKIKDSKGEVTSPTFNINIPSDLAISTPARIDQYQNMPFTFSYTVTGRNTNCVHEFSDNNGSTYSVIKPVKNGTVYSLTKTFNSIGTRNCKIRIKNNAGTERESGVFIINIREPLKGLSLITDSDSYTSIKNKTLNVGYISNRVINSAKLSIDGGVSYSLDCGYTASTITLPITSLGLGSYVCKIKATDSLGYECVSNTFNLKVSNEFISNAFDLVELITDKDIIAGEYTRVAIRLKAKKDIGSSYVLNTKVKYNGSYILKNIQFERGLSATDWRKCSDDVDSEIDGALKIAQSAESKLEKDNLTTTIKNFVEEDGTPVFAQTSQVQQTVDKLEMSFIESGGFNLLRNSAFKNGSENWVASRWGTEAGGVHKIEVLETGSVETLKNRNSIKSTVYGLNSNTASKNLKAGVDSISISAKSDTEYTFQTLISSKRAKQATVECICFSSSGERLNTSSVTFACIENDIEKYTGGNLRENWRKHKQTFISHKDTSSMMVRVYLNEWNGLSDNSILYVAEPMLTEGDAEVLYTPNADEVYSGITSIDRDGIKISMNNGEGEQGFTTIDYQGIEIFDSKKQRKAWFGESETAFIEELETKKLLAPNVVRAHTGSVNIYVAPSGTGDKSGKDESNRIGGIIPALSKISSTYGKYIHGQVVVWIATGHYYESPWVEGFLGAGGITFRFDPGVVFQGVWNFSENHKPIVLEGGRTNNTTNNGAQLIATKDETLINIRNSCVQVNAFRSKNNGATASKKYLGTFITCTRGGHAYISNCDIVRYSSGAIATYGATINVANCRGFVNTPLACQHGGHGVAENYPKGVVGSWADLSGEFHVKGSALPSLYDPTYETTTPVPPPSSWKWVENTFNTTNLKTTTEGSGSSTSGRSDCWGQGKYGSGKAHRGFAEFGSAPSDWAKSGRNWTVTLTMTRLNTAHGSASAVPKPEIKEPNGNFWNSNIAFARGDKKIITLPASIASAVAQGTMKTLEMWVQSNQTTQYSFYNNVTITIKCEKQF